MDFESSAFAQSFIREHITQEHVAHANRLNEEEQQRKAAEVQEQLLAPRAGIERLVSNGLQHASEVQRTTDDTELAEFQFPLKPVKVKDGQSAIDLRPSLVIKVEFGEGELPDGTADVTKMDCGLLIRILGSEADSTQYLARSIPPTNEELGYAPNSGLYGYTSSEPLQGEALEFVIGVIDEAIKESQV